MVVSRRATQGPPYRGFPVEHCRAGSACLTAFNRGTSSNLRRGRCPHRPADRRKRSYILHRQRQRRRSRDDTKFRTRPTETLLADRKGSQETIRFLAHLWLLSVRTESNPPEAWTRRFRHRSRKNTKKPPQQKCCGGWHPMQCIGLCPARPCKPSYNLHRVQQVGCLQHASPLPTSSRRRQPGGLRSTH